MKTKLLLLLVLLLATSISSQAFQESQDYRVLYEKAKYTMETKADLQEAITLFELLIKTYPNEKEYVAKSLLYQGLCYEKLGNQEAVKKYQYLVKNYPEQKNEVAIARERLDRLIQAQTNNKVAESNPESMTLHKVWLGSVTIGWGAVSPNGRFISYPDDKTMNLAIRELSTGKTTVLTNDAAEDPVQFNMGSVTSPDNKQIAYVWYNNNHEIRLIDIDDPEPKLLYGNQGDDVYPCNWSPDGKTIYAKSYLNETGQCQILAITVSTGEVKVLKTFDFFYWLQLWVSPDNQYIAYEFPNITNGEISDTDIHLISTDGKHETTLIKHPANDQILGWFPGKNQILFKSDRSGTWDTWTVSVLNGKVTGEPKRLLTEIGEHASSMGFTDSGTFYYSLVSRVFNASTVPIDLTGGELKSELAKPLLGSFREAEWSPDGKSIALIKELWSLNRRQLIILDVETGKEHEMADWMNVGHLFWTPDSKSVLVIGYDERKVEEGRNNGGMYTIDVQTGETSELLSLSDTQAVEGKDAEIGLLVAQTLAEGAENQKNIFYLKNDQLIRRELTSGQEKILLKNQILSSHDYTLDLSPSGKNLLFCNYDDFIYILSTTGGKPIPVVKAVTTTTGPTVRNRAIWSPDENYIIYTENIDGGYNLWRISAEGENPVKLWQSEVPISTISIHPNGQKIAITTLDQGAEIWKVDKLLDNTR